MSQHCPSVRQAAQGERRLAVGQREKRDVTRAIGQQEPDGASRPLPPPLPAAERVRNGSQTGQRRGTDGAQTGQRRGTDGAQTGQRRVTDGS